MSYKSRFTSEVRRTRNREQIRRSNLARYYAYRDLADAHRAEYRRLHGRHLDEINDKRGPLPGDDEYERTHADDYQDGFTPYE